MAPHRLGALGRVHAVKPVARDIGQLPDIGHAHPVHDRIRLGGDVAQFLRGQQACPRHMAFDEVFRHVILLALAVLAMTAACGCGVGVAVCAHEIVCAGGAALLHMPRGSVASFAAKGAAMQIRLLGRPELVGDGGDLAVRGRQPWAVLARVLLADRPLSRRQLAQELFPETVDPLGALRWCLASLRRALGAEVLTGDPIAANLPEGVRVDALRIEAAEFDPLCAGELLQDSAPEVCGPEFETWLLVERARLATRVAERLRRDTIEALALGQAARALQLARHAVQRDPFDEGAHLHLVRALVLSGHAEAALAHAERTEAQFLAELGTPPVVALRLAARPKAPGAAAPAVQARTLLQAGTAALKAGAVETGLDCLRRASAAAEAALDPKLEAESLAELGTALIHSICGHDEEGMLHLRRAEEMALQHQSRAIACNAVLEQSYSEALAGRRPLAEAMTARALDLADGDPLLLASVHAFAGFNLADWGRHGAADAAHDAAIRAARQSGAARREAWALGLGAWGKLRAGQADAAADWARASLDLCGRIEWLSFRPWPEAIVAEADLALGADPLPVLEGLQGTFAMATHLDDSCWIAAALRAMAAAQEILGRRAQALTTLAQADRAFAGSRDPYVALEVEILRDRTRLTLDDDPEAGAPLLQDLLTMAIRTHAEPAIDCALRWRRARLAGQTV